MRILVFAGSLRKESLNKKLATLIADKIGKLGVEVDHPDFREFSMPVYDGDLDISDGFPGGTISLGQRIEASDGLVIVSPEYNFGVPGPLKNAIDWLSRIRPHPTIGKTGFLASASPGLVGGSRGLIALRPSLSFMGMWLSGDTFSLAQAGQAFKSEDKLEDEDLEKMLDEMLESFILFTKSTSSI